MGAFALGGSRVLSSAGSDPPALAGGHGAEHNAAHGSLGTMGRVDHAANGFDPHETLTDFDGGNVSRDASRRRVREYEVVASQKHIEVAPGVYFDAWTYNGRVPGPTIRATQGDRVIIRFLNGTPHPHTMHFHGIHSAAMDGVPGAGEAYPGEEFTYDFIAEPFGTHLYHCHSLPLARHIARGLYGAFIVDPPGGRPEANEMVLVLNGFDTNFDGVNEVYAANTVAFAYTVDPIRIEAGQLQRAHVINIPADEITVTAELPAQQVGPLDILTFPAVPNHVTTNEANFPIPGQWTITVTARYGEFDQVVFTVDIAITNQ